MTFNNRKSVRLPAVLLTVTAGVFCFALAHLLERSNRTSAQTKERSLAGVDDLVEDRVTANPSESTVGKSVISGSVVEGENSAAEGKLIRCLCRGGGNDHRPAHICVDTKGDAMSRCEVECQSRGYEVTGFERVTGVDARDVPCDPTTKVSSTTRDGLYTANFENEYGRVSVNLPDDMRAGDTISGTVVAEPKGKTPEERAKNHAGLQNYVVAIFAADPRPPKTPPNVIFDLSKGLATPGGSTIVNGTLAAPAKVNTGLFLMPNENSPAGPCRRSGPLVAINEGCSPISQLVFDVPTGRIITADPNITPPTTVTVPTTPSGAVITPDPKITPTFNIPALGQQGRPIEIFGPFDGNASNTTLRFGPPGSKLPEFEKGPENVSGGFGLIRPLAESPRKVVFEAPSDVTGPKQIMVKEGDGAPTTGTYRNVGVQLSAPKTNLMRGEKTTLTVEVRGLEGIQKDVPLQLDSKGVITMDGGNFQNLRIKPTEVTPEGRYTTNRTITGVQAGGFTVTATVIVGKDSEHLSIPLTKDARVNGFNIVDMGGGSFKFHATNVINPRTGKPVESNYQVTSIACESNQPTRFSFEATMLSAQQPQLNLSPCSRASLSNLIFDTNGSGAADILFEGCTDNFPAKLSVRCTMKVDFTAGI